MKKQNKEKMTTLWTIYTLLFGTNHVNVIYFKTLRNIHHHKFHWFNMLNLQLLQSHFSQHQHNVIISISIYLIDIEYIQE